MMQFHKRCRAQSLARLADCRKCRTDYPCVVIVIKTNDRNILRELVAEGQFAYVCHGHTHRFQNELIGKVRVINPGALYHTWPHTVAILDTETDTVEQIRIN